MDFQLYSLAAALVFKDIFFPSDAPGMAIILAMATYATGYLSRPLGAYSAGWVTAWAAPRCFSTRSP